MRVEFPGYVSPNSPVRDLGDGIRLTMAIEASGMSRNEIAERAGIHRRTLQNIEHGRTYGNIATWRALAKALGCSVDDITGDDW